MGKFLGSLSVSLVLASNLFGTCMSWGCIDTIETLSVNSGGEIHIGMNGDERVAKCKSKDDFYFTMTPDMVAYKEMYATLLAAKMADKPIEVRVVENSEGCKIAYVRLEN